MLTARNKGGPVVLVSAPVAYAFPTAYAYLAGELRRAGESVAVLFRDDTDPAATAAAIMACNPVLVGLGSLYVELEAVRAVVAALDAAGRTFPVVIGGGMSSPIPAFALARTGADYACLGEGELTLVALTQALRAGADATSLLGLAARRDDGRIVVNEAGPYIRDLTKLPLIPFDLFPTERWLNIGDWYAKSYPHQDIWRAGDRVINLHGARGCPSTCNFCAHFSPCRYRPLDDVFADAKAQLEMFDANVLYFSDETALASPRRAEQVVDHVARLDRRVWISMGTTFNALARIDDHLLRELKRVGLRIIGLGAESGSDRVLQTIDPGTVSAVEMQHQLRRLHDVGIYATTTMQFGQRGETREDAEQTIAFVEQAVTYAPEAQWNFTITTPFPGSPLFQLLLSSGSVGSMEQYHEIYLNGRPTAARVGWCNQIVNLSAMSPDEVLGYYHRAHETYRTVKARMLGRSVTEVC